MPSKGKPVEKPTLDESLAALEALVERMESGELSLDESLQVFEKGVRLTRECQQALAEAEQRVRILLAEAPDGVPQDFTDDVADEQS